MTSDRPRILAPRTAELGTAEFRTLVLQDLAQSSILGELQAVLSGRGREPLPETLRQTAGDGKFVARPVVGLPQQHGYVRNEGGGRIPRLERAGMKIDRHPFRQGIAHTRAGEDEERATVALVDERRQTGKGCQARLHSLFGRRMLKGKPPA